MWPPGSEDSYSAKMDYGKSVVNILPSVEMLVNFNGDMTRSSKRSCLLYAERVDFKELLVNMLVKTSSVQISIHPLPHSNSD